MQKLLSFIAMMVFLISCGGGSSSSAPAPEGSKEQLQQLSFGDLVQEAKKRDEQLNKLKTEACGGFEKACMENLIAQRDVVETFKNIAGILEGKSKTNEDVETWSSTKIKLKSEFESLTNQIVTRRERKEKDREEYRNALSNASYNINKNCDLRVYTCEDIQQNQISGLSTTKISAILSTLSSLKYLRKEMEKPKWKDLYSEANFSKEYWRRFKPQKDQLDMLIEETEGIITDEYDNTVSNVIENFEEKIAPFLAARGYVLAENYEWKISSKKSLYNFEDGLKAFPAMVKISSFMDQKSKEYMGKIFDKKYGFEEGDKLTQIKSITISESYWRSEIKVSYLSSNLSISLETL